MTKITTQDCKEFIANFQARNPQLEQARFNPKEGDWDYEETIKLLKSAIIAKNWKRLYKKNPDPEENPIYSYYKDGCSVNRFADSYGEIDNSDVKCERGFELENSDGQIAYMVLELQDGTLLLGEYIGD